MIKMLVAEGASVNKATPSVTFPDGCGYGDISPLMFSLSSLATTTLLLSLGANIPHKRSGLPGYEDIPRGKFNCLLLSGGGKPTSMSGENEAVSKYLVKQGADINWGAAWNSGMQDQSTAICSYWLYVVASGDTEGNRMH